MARMGDFLQTTPLLHGLKKEHPEAEICVLVDERVVETAGHCPDVDTRYSIDSRKIMRCMLEIEDTMQRYEVLNDACSELHGQVFDTLVNLNYSALTNTLSSIPRAETVRGYRFADSDRSITKDPWFSFFNATFDQARLAPFNLVDYFYYCAGRAANHPKKTYFSVNPASHAKTVKRLVHLMPEDSMCIALQLGSRHPQRTWPVDSFVELANRLLQYKNIHLLLLGTGEDRSTEQEFLRGLSIVGPQSVSRVHSFIDKTSLQELAAVLKCSDLLITGDTGTMHMATAVDCRTLALFFGPAYVFHTGPYGENHWIIQGSDECSPCVEDQNCRRGYACKTSIIPEDVMMVSEHILFGHSLKKPLSSTCRILSSDFDDFGIVFKHEAGLRNECDDVQNACYRTMGTVLLDDCDFDSAGKCGYEQGMHVHGLDGVLQAIESAETLMNSYYSNPYATETARLDMTNSFWHPWLNCYHDMKESALCRKAAQQRASTSFINGLTAGTGMLRQAIMQ